MYPLGGTRMPAHGGWGTSCQGAWVPACGHSCLRPGVRCGPEHRELLGMVTHHIPDSLFPSQNLPRAQAPIKHTFSIGSCRPSVGTHHALTRSSQFLAPQHTDSCTTTHTICTTTHPRQSGRISAFSGHRRRSEVVKPDFDLHHSTQTPLGGGGTSMICPPCRIPPALSPSWDKKERVPDTSNSSTRVQGAWGCWSPYDIGCQPPRSREIG